MRFALATCLARGSLGFARRTSEDPCHATAARCTRSEFGQGVVVAPTARARPSSLGLGGS